MVRIIIYHTFYILSLSRLTWIGWMLSDCCLVQSIFFVICCKIWYKYVMQEPWAGTAWWGWDFPTALFGMSPMPSIYFLVTLTWRTSPISRCWPSWRSSLVSNFINCQRLSAHTQEPNVSEKKSPSGCAMFPLLLQLYPRSGMWRMWLVSCCCARANCATPF